MDYSPTRMLLQTFTPDQRRVWRDAVAGRASAYALACLADARGRSDQASMVLALYEADAPAEMLREALRIAWSGEGREWLIAACVAPPVDGYTPPTVLELFRRAAFDPPANLPDELTVWRGLTYDWRSADRPLDQALATPQFTGMPWTTDRDAACAIAVLQSNETPLLIRRTVPRDAVLWAGPWRPNADLPAQGDQVVFDLPPAGEVDGRAAEWRERAACHLSRLDGRPVVGEVPSILAGVEEVRAAMTGLAASSLDGLLADDHGEAHARRRVDHIPHPLLPHVIRLLWLHQAPRTNLRVAFMVQWITAHHGVLKAFPTVEEVREVMRAAEFAKPETPAGTIEVWRGTAGISAQAAGEGHSWSLTRGYAAWSAMQYAAGAVHPLLLRAVVPVERVLFWNQVMSGTSEVVFDGPVLDADVDGDRADWTVASAEFGRYLRGLQGGGRRPRGTADGYDRATATMMAWTGTGPFADRVGERIVIN